MISFRRVVRGRLYRAPSSPELDLRVRVLATGFFAATFEDSAAHAVIRKIPKNARSGHLG